MASLSFLKCNKCGESYRLSNGFPFYTDQETGQLVYPMVPVPLELHPKIEGHRYSKFCKVCSAYVDVLQYKDRDAPECPNCGQNDFLDEGDPCPKCKQGSVGFDDSRTAYF